MRVIKRDGSLEEFNAQKIQRALMMAFIGQDTNVSPLVHRVLDRLIGVSDPVPIGTIQDAIEQTLVGAGHVEVARKYMGYRLERDRARNARLIPDPNALSDYIHVGKYAQYDESLGRREKYSETVARVRDMHLRRYPRLADEIDWAFRFVFDKKVLPSMRSMQFAGAAIERDHARMYNCSFTLVDRPRAFQEIMYLLMCGSGVGYSVQWHHIEKLPPLGRVDKKNVTHFIIPDTKEGWADAVGALIEGAITGEWVEFAYHQIRAEGEPLRTSGGRAPGHVQLREALEAIRRTLSASQGRRLRPIEVHDIICFMAEAVYSGGIRRSALISLFSPNDTEMLYAKAEGVFDPVKGLNNQRQMANNSAVLHRGHTHKSVFERVIRIAQENYGDPGFFFTDHEDFGTNPCGEIGLDPSYEGETGFGFCNLCEVNVATCGSADEFYDACRAASLIGTLQAGYTDFDYLGPIAEACARRDALLGIGLVGIMDNIALVRTPGVLTKGAEECVSMNKRIASVIGINAAARVTCVKPSGTSSLELGGIGAGIHPRWARRTLRRVVASPNEAPAAYFRKLNPHMVETKPNGDWILTFPLQAADDAVTVKNLSADEFLDTVLLVYEHWVKPGTVRDYGLTHNVSCTITVRDGEMDSLISRIWDERFNLSALSFVPYTLDVKFPYAPFEEALDDEAWNKLIRLYKTVDWSLFVEGSDDTSLAGEIACSGGVCAI